MDLFDLDVHELGERVKALHGDAVYHATLARALAIATRTNCSDHTEPSEYAALRAGVGAVQAQLQDRSAEPERPK